MIYTDMVRISGCNFPDFEHAVSFLFKNNLEISVDLKRNAWENYWWIDFDMEGLASDI